MCDQVVPTLKLTELDKGRSPQAVCRDRLLLVGAFGRAELYVAALVVVRSDVDAAREEPRKARRAWTRRCIERMQSFSTLRRVQKPLFDTM